MMDKHIYNKGFALLEMLIFVMIMSLLMGLVLHKLMLPDLSYRLLPSLYLKTQSEALRDKQDHNFEVDLVDTTLYTDIIFNEKGNVNQAQTINSHNKEIVIELGMGRLVEK